MVCGRGRGVRKYIFIGGVNTHTAPRMSRVDLHEVSSHKLDSTGDATGLPYHPYATYLSCQLGSGSPLCSVAVEEFLTLSPRVCFLFFSFFLIDLCLAPSSRCHP